MNKLLLATLILVFSSCQTQKKWLKKGYEKGWLKDSVTLKAESTKGDKVLTLDSNALKNALDSLTDMYLAMLDSCDNIKTPNGLINIKDSAKREYVKQAVKKKIKDKLLEIPCTFEPISDSTQRYLLKIWVANGKINYTLNIPEQKVGLNVVEERKWWDNFGIGAVSMWILFIILLFIKHK